MIEWFDPDAIRGDIEQTLTDEFAPLGYEMIYENVPSALKEFGAIRIQISWGGTENQSLFCPDGTLRSISGVLSCWVFTPLHQGTSRGLKAAAKMRQVFAQWPRLGTCGREVRISAVSGPRSIAATEGDDYFAHVLTATLTAMEQIEYLR